MVPGLLLDSLITLMAIFAVVKTELVPHGLKIGFFGAICVWTGLAVANNLATQHALGLVSFTAAAG